MNYLLRHPPLPHTRQGSTASAPVFSKVRVRVHTLMTHPLFDVAVRSLFSQRPNFESGNSFHGLEDLLHGLRGPEDELMDILITDITPNARTTPRLMAELRQLRQQLAVVHLIPETDDAAVIVQAFRWGADAYLFQTAPVEVLEQAVNTVLEGKAYIQTHLTPLVLAEIRRPDQAVFTAEIDVPLNEREQMLLQLATDGLNNRAIAEVFGVTEKTVRGMWSTLIRKLGVNDRTQAVLWSIRSGFTRLH
ncbi:response regulator transcription factor [Alicyclobacillus shizuokensis]|uniref:response regulator transcription factor n=1 Tax=Alicyclobacillus shizuokensis TaxID=392014 RepID=UPI00082B9375|nr:response regulator transcription factor [Alicyclobacillus shizuokensis]MCL6626264.1 response regulator transcription factor [Alicyclobacillus shizuokensis]